MLVRFLVATAGLLVLAGSAVAGLPTAHTLRKSPGGPIAAIAENNGVAAWFTASTKGCNLVHILSPFDQLVIQRKRTKLFFGYEHLFEAYVPKPKRVLGYFALPVLVGDEIVAAVDLKTDRQNRKLLVQQWTWVGPAGKRGNGSARKELKRRIEDELGRFETFQLGE